MELTVIGPVAEVVVFGLVVTFVQYLIKGSRSPWPLWQWLGDAFWTACMAWIILFGLIKL